MLLMFLIFNNILFLLCVFLKFLKPCTELLKHVIQVCVYFNTKVFSLSKFEHR